MNSTGNLLAPEQADDGGPGAVRLRRLDIAHDFSPEMQKLAVSASRRAKYSDWTLYRTAFSSA